jgi:hypothetical protein
MTRFHARAFEGNLDLGPMNKYLDNKTKNEPVCFFYLLKFIILNRKILFIFFLFSFLNKILEKYFSDGL